MLKIDDCVLILGFGLTGKSFIDFCKKKRIKYFIFSDKKEEILSSEEKDNFFYDTEENWQKVSTVLISPSFRVIFNPHFIIAKAKLKQIKILSDFDLFYNEIHSKKLKKKPKIIAVTGTNGKSTTASLIYFLFKSLKLKAKLVGNIGLPILYELKSRKLADYYIVEASSYQIEISNKIKYDFGIFLNISKDHLDYHGSFENYSDAKWKMLFSSKKVAFRSSLAQNKSEEFLNILLKRGSSIVSEIKEEKIFSNIVENNANTRFFYSFDKEKGTCFVRILNKKKLLEFQEKFNNLKGFYNVENILFAISALEGAFGRKTFSFIKQNLEKILKIIKRFKNLEHRNELFLKIKNNNDVIEFINDSKATNLDAVSLTLDVLGNKKICLIMGGVSKELTPKDIDIKLLRNVAGVFLIGNSVDLFYNELRQIKNSLNGKESFKFALIEIKKSEKLEHAVKDSFDFAKRNNCEAVVLSPMCASFDQFKNYQERGLIFKKICKNLIGEGLENIKNK